MFEQLTPGNDYYLLLSTGHLVKVSVSTRGTESYRVVMGDGVVSVVLYHRHIVAAVPATDRTQAEAEVIIGLAKLPDQAPLTTPKRTKKS